MSVLSIPNSFVSGTLAQSSQVNANFNAVASWSTNVDNTNIGVAGIFASQIIPLTGAQGTFGGAVGYTFDPGSTSVVPLTVAAPSGQASDILDVTLNALKVYSVAANGQTLIGQRNLSAAVTPLSIDTTALQSADLLDLKVNGGNVVNFQPSGLMGTTGGVLLNTPGVNFTASQIGLTNDGQGAPGVILNVPASLSGAGLQFQAANFTRAQIHPNGDLQVAPLINSVNTLGRVAPAYNLTGATRAATWHQAFGIVSIGPGASSTVTLSGAAVFTGQDSYHVSATTNSSGGVGQVPGNVGNISGTQFVITNTTGNTNTYHWLATGE